MNAERIDAFESAMGPYATASRVPSDQFAAELASRIEEPAVGLPLPFDGVSLADTAVETEWSPADLERARTGVTAATAGIAATGTVVLSSDSAGTELASLYVPVHVAVVPASEIVEDVKHAYEGIEARFEGGSHSAVLATGPSATADMGTLVYGVHGPHEVHVIVLEDR